MEKVFIMIKPDGMKSGAFHEVFKRLEKAGLEIIDIMTLRPSKRLVGRHYDRKAFTKYRATRQQMIRYIADKRIILMVWEGKNACKKAKQIKGGNKDPRQCKQGTIRFEYMHDTLDLARCQGRAVYNTMHSSDTPKESEREIKIWFHGNSKR